MTECIVRVQMTLVRVERHALHTHITYIHTFNMHACILCEYTMTECIVRVQMTLVRVERHVLHTHITCI